MNPDTPTTPRVRVLILEDELLIRDRIKHYLVSADVDRYVFEFTPAAQTVGAAKAIVEAGEVDLALLDIQLESGPETGIVFAAWLRATRPHVPLIYVTSYFDDAYFDDASVTNPNGYLTKPIQRRTLVATVFMALAQRELPAPTLTLVPLSPGAQQLMVPVDEIYFLVSDHVYVTIYGATADQSIVTTRASLTQLLNQLPAERFARTHRSYGVNLDKVTRWSSTEVFVGPHAVPVSRIRRERVFGLLKDRG